ncbi:hypothetical protein D082_17530 [Synechocystis sp. PCC 6714]|nr:hypothetical protein D082_17530 [Synechocystis sp. PCC 6714]
MCQDLLILLGGSNYHPYHFVNIDTEIIPLASKLFRESSAES